MNDQNTSVPYDIASIQAACVETPEAKPEDCFVFHQTNQSKPLMVISEKTGTVGIDLDPQFIRMLVTSNRTADLAWDHLIQQPPGPDTEKQLIKLITGAINAFHQNVYAMTQPHADVRCLPDQETPNAT